MLALHYSTTQLDQILKFQFAVAWAGEGLSEPPRMEWWRTDLVDMDGGGDLLRRLLPKTYQWAVLEAVRETAIRVDRLKRNELARPDLIRTLFFWGVTLDEQLGDRIEELKKHSDQNSPESHFNLSLIFKEKFSQKGFEAFLRLPSGAVDYKITPAGREITIDSAESPESCTKKLAAALLPLSNEYPMPFYRLENR